MNLISSYLFFTICLFAQITNEEMTTATITDTVSETREPNVKETTEYKDETKKATTVGNINLEDFKITKLKGHHFENEHTEVCLANVDPQKVEAVKKSIRNHDGKVEYVPADPSHISDEDIKIANCLKKEVEEKMTLTTKYEPVEKNIEANSENVTNLNSDNSKTNSNTVNKAKNDARREDDTQYQFQGLDYYDDELVFDNTTCPDKVEVIELELSEVRRYDLECQQITHWTGLQDVSNMFYG